MPHPKYLNRKIEKRKRILLKRKRGWEKFCEDVRLNCLVQNVPYYRPQFNRKRKASLPHISQIKSKNILTPNPFNLQFDNVEGVLGFIKDLKKAGRRCKLINIDMRSVTDIGEGAIAMLLSVLEELDRKRIAIRGDKPTDSYARGILERSGYFKYFTTQISKSNQVTKNTILRTGNIQTSQNELTPLIHSAMETVWKVKSRCPLLYGGINEMFRNSCDHAFYQNEDVKWHLGVSHFDKENYVKFSFVDNGEGIIKTYENKKMLEMINNFFSSNASFLKSAFENGIKSKTGLDWRGKGLPTIYEMYLDNIITNLVVITNNVYLDFDRKVFTTLSNNFSGTYYFWIVNTKCNPSYFPLSVNNDNN